MNEKKGAARGAGGAGDPNGDILRYLRGSFCTINER